MNNVYDILKQIIIELIYKYQSNPFQYFYEEDIRAELYCQLKDLEIFNMILKTSEKNKWLKEYSKAGVNEFSISSIKAEYPSQKRFDIACINREKFHNCSSENHYVFDCEFGMELKLSQGDNHYEKFLADIKKLKEYSDLISPFTGIALNFEQEIMVNSDSILKYLPVKEFTKFKSPDEFELYENKINAYYVFDDEILSFMI